MLSFSVMSNSLYSMDCSPLGSSVHGIFLSRILEWLPFPTPRDIPNPGLNAHLLHLLHWQANSLPLAPPGKPKMSNKLGKLWVQYVSFGCAKITKMQVTTIQVVYFLDKWKNIGKKFLFCSKVYVKKYWSSPTDSVYMGDNCNPERVTDLLEDNTNWEWRQNQIQRALNPIRCFFLLQHTFHLFLFSNIGKRMNKNIGGKFPEFLNLVLNCPLSSVIQSGPTLCDPMDCSMPGFPVHHQFLELTQTHILESVMPSNHLILCHPFLLSPSIFPSIRVFSKESVLCIRWPKYWSFSFSISPSNEYSGLISFWMDWLKELSTNTLWDICCYCC